jgi:superfamily II DNA or RNA helicase
MINNLQTTLSPELFKYQEPHVEALLLALEKYNTALDASDLGTGKTICACAVAKRRNQELVTVCKKVMIPTWRYWMDRFSVSGVVGNWELARRRGLPNRRGALYCFDEVHEGAGYKTLNARLLVNTFEAKHSLLLLSATAIESPLKMWALGYILGFHNLKDYYRWMFKNGVVKNFGYGGYHFNGSKKVLQNINQRIFSERGARMRKALIPDFPECQYIVELVQGDPLSPDLAAWFKQIDIREMESEQKRENEEAPWDASGSVLPEILYSRMRAELSKVPALIELVKEGWESGYRVVVFVNFLYTMAALEALLALEKDQLIHGEQKMEERLAAITCFQKGAINLLVSTIDSGGASIDLHDLEGDAPRMALLCPTWRAVTFRQALGRVHRAGAKSKSVQKLVFLGEGIEVRVAERVREKLSAIDTINDADLNQEEFVSP